jgi:hypothetical protein
MIPASGPRCSDQLAVVRLCRVLLRLVKSRITPGFLHKSNDLSSFGKGLLIRDFGFVRAILAVLAAPGLVDIARLSHLISRFVLERGNAGVSIVDEDSQED